MIYVANFCAMHISARCSGHCLPGLERAICRRRDRVPRHRCAAIPPALPTRRPRAAVAAQLVPECTCCAALTPWSPSSPARLAASVLGEKYVRGEVGGEKEGEMTPIQASESGLAIMPGYKQLEQCKLAQTPQGCFDHFDHSAPRTSINEFVHLNNTSMTVPYRYMTAYGCREIIPFDPSTALQAVQNQTPRRDLII